jgi:superfamily II DNA/RNA helicase
MQGFSSNPTTVDFLERVIRQEGHRVIGIHGDKSQLQRDQVSSRVARTQGCQIFHGNNYQNGVKYTK